MDCCIGKAVMIMGVERTVIFFFLLQFFFFFCSVLGTAPFLTRQVTVSFDFWKFFPRTMFLAGTSKVGRDGWAS